MTPQRRPHPARKAAPRGTTSGFTMIELLTVIAIIAILAAIVFPVGATVRENARRTACMSNMKQIYQGVRQYELDNRQYPAYLFGPAVNAQGVEIAPGGAGTGAAVSMSDAASVSKVRGQGLYPEYVKSIDVFHCPNNGNASSPKDPAQVAIVERPEWDRTATPPQVVLKQRAFYIYDSYDINPRLDVNAASPKLATPTTYVARYSKNWTDVFPPNQIPTNPKDFKLYQSQLHWRTPPESTYITACTYHVNGDKLILLWLNGTTKVVDVRKAESLKSQGAGAAYTDYDLYKLGPTD